MSDFVAQLRKLSEHCRFGDQLEDMLRDRLVCGCRDKQLQRTLLAQQELTFDKAFKMARAMEMAEQEVRDLQQYTSQSVHAVHSGDATHTNAQLKKEQSSCYSCGGKHLSTVCKFKTSTCHYCHKQGHIATVCRTKIRDNKKKTSLTKPTHQLQVDDNTQVSPYAMFYTPSSRSNPILVTVTLNEVDHTMEVDTGATLSVMSEATYESLWSKKKPQLIPCSSQLKTYTGEQIKVKGAISVNVRYKGQNHQLSLVVVNGSGPSLLGRDWFRVIRLDWSYLKHVQAASSSRYQEVVDRYSSVFKDELGLIKGIQARFEVDANAQPKFCRARPVPYALRSKVEAELERLEKSNIITPVTFSKWAAPIVPVLKQDGKVRICGDYKLTLNQVTKIDPYPLPRIEDLFASLSKGSHSPSWT